MKGQPLKFISSTCRTMCPIDYTRPNARPIVIIFLCLLVSLLAANAPAQESLPQTTRDLEEVKEPTPMDQSAVSEAQPTGGSPLLPRLRSKFINLLVVAGLGFLLGWVRLLAKFYRFWGLGILTNPFTWLFLVLVAAASAGSYALYIICVDPQKMMWGLIAKSGLGPLLEFFGPTVTGNVITIVGRFSRASRLDTGATSQVKELEKVKSNNFFLELIRVAIGDRMDQEVARLARRYDLDLIKEVVERLVNNAIELGQVTPKDGEAGLEFILGFEPCADERTDFNNKYKALHRAIRMSSFRQLRSRLERDAREQL